MLLCARTMQQPRSRFTRAFASAIDNSRKLRIAYISGEFRTHPTALSFVDVLERHDRAGFETIGISLGPDDGSEARARIVRSFDQFHDVRMKGDREVAASSSASI